MENFVRGAFRLYLTLGSNQFCWKHGKFHPKISHAEPPISIIESRSKRKSLTDCGLVSPCTFNVISEVEEVAAESQEAHVLQPLLQQVSDNLEHHSGMLVVLKPVNNRGEEEEAEDDGGVFRDLMSSFWPKKLFATVALFGEKSVSSSLIRESFFRFIPSADCEILKSCLSKENLDLSGEDEEVVDVLSNFSLRRLPATGQELEKLELEIAHRLIVQRPCYIKDAWEENPTVADGRSTKPTRKGKLRNLQEFVRTLRKDDIPLFMRYVTGQTPCVSTKFLSCSMLQAVYKGE
eukprot:gene2340-2693_t